MGKPKGKKIMKLTDEEYNAYIMSLKDDAPLYGADGEMFVPESIKPYEPEEKNR